MEDNPCEGWTILRGLYWELIFVGEAFPRGAIIRGLSKGVFPGGGGGGSLIGWVKAILGFMGSMF